jgi:hypothetical protein
VYTGDTIIRIQQLIHSCMIVLQHSKWGLERGEKNEGILLRTLRSSSCIIIHPYVPSTTIH